MNSSVVPKFEPGQAGAGSEPLSLLELWRRLAPLTRRASVLGALVLLLSAGGNAWAGETQTRKAVKFSDAIPYMKSGQPTAASGTASGTGSVPRAVSPAGMQALKVLTPKELAGLLQQRVDGAMSGTFDSFANGFIGLTRDDLGFMVGLHPGTPSVARQQLQRAFASSYDPTLKELFDAIAVQTQTKWAYKPDGQFVKSSKPVPKPVEGFAVFEFTPAKRDLTYQVRLPAGWQSEDKGSFIKYFGPSFPLAVDVFPQGRVSIGGTDSKGKEQLRLYAYQLSIDWAKKVRPDVKPSELGTGRVGAYDAITFDTMVERAPGQKVHWRQWVVADPVTRNVYFILSSILPEKEREIYPGVQELLASFKIL